MYVNYVLLYLASGEGNGKPLKRILILFYLIDKEAKVQRSSIA